MSYVLNSLTGKPVFWIKVFAPTDSGDAIRILMSIHEKIKTLKENQSLHLVLDISTFSFSDKFPTSQLISVLGQAHDKWNTKYQLTSWIAVDSSLYPVIRSFVRSIKLSAHIYTDHSEVVDAIEKLLGATEGLNRDSAWDFLN